ncbi:MAG: carboxyl transferase [Ruminococcus sp.]|nr:carboxyl transferase [Ruminococcus sp.]
MEIEVKLREKAVLDAFFDEGSFVETDAHLSDAEVVAGYGAVDGVTVFAFAQNVEERGGAMSKAHFKKISKIYKLALKTGAPVVGFYDSTGARLEQKYEMLSAYGDILKKSSTLSGVVPQISVILGNCLGTTALVAASADFVIMSETARLSVDTLGENASAQDNQKAGIASFVCRNDEESVKKARELLSYLPANNLEPAPAYEPAAPFQNPDKLPKYICDEDSLLCVGDGFGENVCTAFGRAAGMPVALVRTKGGVLCAAECEKIARFVRFADAFSIPVVTLVDAEKFGSTKSASKVVCAYAEATTAKIAIVEGEATGAVYIALAGESAGADAVFALPEAVISPVAPLAAAYILDETIGDLPFEEQEKSARQFIKANLTAEKAAEDGYIDAVVDKTELRSHIVAALEMLSSKRTSSLPKKHTTIL